MLVNTSFNARGEPIVCTPTEAYACFMRTAIDLLDWDHSFYGVPTSLRLRRKPTCAQRSRLTSQYKEFAMPLRIAAFLLPFGWAGR